MLGLLAITTTSGCWSFLLMRPTLTLCHVVPWRYGDGIHAHPSCPHRTCDLMIFILSRAALNTVLSPRLRMPRGAEAICCVPSESGAEMTFLPRAHPQGRTSLGHTKISTQNDLTTYQHLPSPPPIHFSILRYQFLVSHSAHKTLKID